MKRKISILLFVIAALVATGFILRDPIERWLFPTQAPPTSTTTSSPTPVVEEQSLTVFAENLTTPWALAWLPSGDMLATERSGTLRLFGEAGQSFPISGVKETSEGGLLGLAIHPNFETNHLLYIYLTTQSSKGTENRVDSYNLSGTSLTYLRTILGGIPAADRHDGGGIAFGPDKKLYITTGDATQADTAQDTTSLAGKILRINDDGSIPSDNPFGNAVWSYGHRNPQGIVWDDQGRLWSVEHGPSGERNGYGKDELNLIEKGANYGWPIIAGDTTATGMRTPVAHSGDNETWAPSGIAYVNGSLYFAGLRGQTLYKATIKPDNSVSLTAHFVGEFGRLRAVTARENVLYVSTSNRDGRGTPRETDDRILQIPVNAVK